MTKFTMSMENQQTLEELGLEYNCMDRSQQIFRNRFSLNDGTVLLEVLVKESEGIGDVTIKEKGRIKNYPSVKVERLNLLVINFGRAFELEKPYISVRILEGFNLLNHTEFKQ